MNTFSGRKKLLVFVAIVAGLLVLVRVGDAFAVKNGALHYAPKKLERQRAIPKGGIGLIKNRLYIVTASMRNELLLANGRRWSGLGWKVPQVVVVWRNEVMDMNAVPKDFVPGESVIISFQPDYVDVIDPEAGLSFYYVRDTEPPPSEQAAGSPVVNPYQ